MSLQSEIRAQLNLPLVCAPMFRVTGPDLVREACKAGIVGALPRANARSTEQFEGWLCAIRADLQTFSDNNPTARIGPLAVNLATRLAADELIEQLEICRRYGVRIIISAVGDPTELVDRVHDWGGVVFHDVVNLRFAEKAIAADVDGLTCIGAGGGGSSGTISPLTLIPRIRSMFDGVILMAGALGDGAAIRAAEILGADLAYMGTRFIATREADVSDDYKRLLVSQHLSDLLYTPKITGVAANWMRASLEQNGLDPKALPSPVKGSRVYSHLPPEVRPWKTLWSAGQGIELIDDIPAVSELVSRLRGEYLAACARPSLVEAAGTID